MSHNRLLYLTPDDWTLLNAKAKRRTFKLGEEIIREGSWGDKLYIVRKGCATVELAGSRSRSVVAVLGSEDVCGDMAFVEKGKASAAVIASDEVVEVDEIYAEDLNHLFEAFPRLAIRFYRSLTVILARRLRDTSRQLAREMSLREAQKTNEPPVQSSFSV